MGAFSKSSQNSPGFDRSRIRRWTSFAGLFFDDHAVDSAWIRERGTVRLPRLPGPQPWVLEGITLAADGLSGLPGLQVRVDGQPVGRVPATPGPWRVPFQIPTTPVNEPVVVELVLLGVGWSNTLAWLGRITGWPSLQPYRSQGRNRQLRVLRLCAGTGECVYDFTQRQSPFSAAFARAHFNLGLNIAGFLTADLGVGESARCMVKAADAAGISTALIDLQLPCKNRRGDLTYAPRLGSQSPHPVTVVHVDPPASRDLEHHHGPDFRRGHYLIGYWAWELPEFPDAWLSAFDYFDEIWCPSDFTRDAIGFKSPLPVITMPHAIAFPRPEAPVVELRRKLGLPERAFLFLVLYDLNSYSDRKNPQAAIEAFRRSQLHAKGARLVIKVHSVAGNEADLAALRASISDLPETILLTETLSRADLTALQTACDCYVSLHRAEGFGLAVAECMYLGKPVITTDWSATREFADVTCALPVPARTIAIERSRGPYARGQLWADPDIDAAAEQMRRVANDPGLRDRLGQAARARIEDRLSPAAVGARYRRRLEAIATH